MDGNKLKEAFQKASYHPESRLSDDIWSFIQKKELIQSKIKFWSYSSIGLFSLIGFIPVFKSLLTRMSTSGFYDYLSMAFSGGSTISYYWKEFLLSLVDSLPFTSLVFSLFLLFILIISIKKSLEQLKYKLLLA